MAQQSNFEATSENPPTSEPADHDLGFRCEMQPGHRMPLKTFAELCEKVAGLLAEIEKSVHKRKRARIVWEIVELTCTAEAVGIKVRAARSADYLWAIEEMFRKVAPTRAAPDG